MVTEPLRPIVDPVDVMQPGETYYPQSTPTAHDLLTELAGVASSHEACASFYLDATEGMSDSGVDDGIDWVIDSQGEGEDHAQGLARTHVLSDHSVYWFLSFSEVGDNEHGTLTQYRYDGPLDVERVLQGSPLGVAPMVGEPLMIQGRHPSDIAFLPDVNGADAGYLLVTEEDDEHLLTVYRWTPGQPLTVQGQLPPAPLRFPAQGPNFLFIDRRDDRYLLGIASNNWGVGYLYWADKSRLFPSNSPGALDVSAFELDTEASPFSFPVVGGPCQTKLIRDPTDWYLLAFRGLDNDKENATDYVDVYPVSFDPFRIAERSDAIPIAFNAGDTSFASTGTHHVEVSGRLLVSSSYRWAEDEGPGDSSFVIRVDECPSATPGAAPGGSGSGSNPIDVGRPPHHPN